MAARKQRRRRRARDPWWVEASTDELLDLRFCDLGLSIEGSALGARIERLYAELERAGLRFKPYVWLSHEWFTPEGASGFAVPFYLAHPRLVRLEHSQMFEAEASTAKQCMRFLRHETAHALDFAYRLHHRADWRRTFGRYGQPYRDDYQPNPTSRRFVQNLGNWYAQSHPVEDWAETFSVWLAPNSRWRTTYAGWPALQKLEAVDTLMREIGKKRPLVTTRTRDDSLPTLRTTLREHYAQKKDAYGHGQPWRHDRQLRLIFSPPTKQESGKQESGKRGATAGAERAAKFVLEHRNELRTKVSALTGAHRFVVDESIDSLVRRCRELDLRVLRARSQARLGAAVLLTMLTMSLANGGRPRFSR